MVSENSFKFFIQFVFYTAIFCLFALIVCAVFTAELKKEVRTFLPIHSAEVVFAKFDAQTGSVNPHWCVAIGL